MVIARQSHTSICLALPKPCDHMSAARDRKRKRARACVSGNDGAHLRSLRRGWRAARAGRRGEYFFSCVDSAANIFSLAWILRRIFLLLRGFWGKLWKRHCEEMRGLRAARAVCQRMPVFPNTRTFHGIVV